MDTIKVNDIVKYRDEFPDENNTRYKVLEVNGDRCLIQALTILFIHPTYIAKIPELEKIS
jgi:hypothetical protein